jgi:hypothetical protein
MAIGAKSKLRGNPAKEIFPRFHLFGSSLASAFLTLDWEIPNCRAILAGVIPALKAERTAFT